MFKKLFRVDTALKYVFLATSLLLASGATRQVYHVDWLPDWSMIKNIRK